MMKIIYLNVSKRANSAANPELNFLVVNLEKAEYSNGRHCQFFLSDHHDNDNDNSLVASYKGWHIDTHMIRM